MANDIKIVVKKGRKYKGIEKKIDLISTNITSRTKKASEEQLQEIKQLMKNKISAFSSSGELSRGLVIDPVTTDKDGFKMRLRSTAPHSLANELGVKPHIVRVLGRPRFEEWTYDKFGTVPYKIMVGGANSHIKKGNSKNVFFRPSVNEYISGSKSRSKFMKALRLAMKDTFK